MADCKLNSSKEKKGVVKTIEDFIDGLPEDKHLAHRLEVALI